MDLGILTFFQDIRNFFRYSRVLGVDIGTVSIKCIEISRGKKNTLALETYGMLSTKEYLTRGNAALHSSSLKLAPQEIIPLLITLLRETKPTAKHVVASIPLFAVFVVSIDMPVLSPQETAKSVTFQARQYIPISASAVTMDWVKIGEFQRENGQKIQRVLITAIPNDLIAQYRAIFHGVGLTLDAIEIESQAIARALGNVGDQPTLIIDIGALSTGITIIEGVQIVATGQTDYGGMALTQALARGLDISAWRAEELKRRRGLLGVGGERELSTSLLPFLDVIIQECNRVRMVYERTTHRTVQRLMLIGGGANLPGIEEYVRTQLNMPNVPAPAFSKMHYPTNLEPVIRTLQNEFAVAAGCAFRYYL